MPSLPLLLVLSALPCADRDAVAQRLEETARARPQELNAEVNRLVEQLEGVPLPPGTSGQTPQDRAHQLTVYLDAVCKLETGQQSGAPEVASNPERLRAILDRPEFARARQRNSDVVTRLLRELETWLEGLFESRGAQGFAVATRAVMLGVALAVVLFGVLRVRWRRNRKVVLAAGTQGEAPPLELDTPGEHLGRARTALETQDSREAIREGLLGLLSTLEQRKLARPDRVKTNRELAAELPTRGAPARVTGEVERLVGWYDQAFYSLEPVPPDEAARFVESVEQLHGSLAEGRP
ncbi:O-antigen ligase family protein [Corallococcus sp. bb12-1]|uniref:O-antigen ligase family protein n=1 Tax=Corallococcus sp. bb12-1 TaxID=2996784 RepID=UPI00226DBC04|nr:O-antigen ligase family protein [Corallococcus sp. bb12-1]MCY1041784.1 O-antigen ligase family protein [Corallococcus sp. bb12-1]